MTKLQNCKNNLVQNSDTRGTMIFNGLNLTIFFFGKKNLFYKRLRTTDLGVMGAHNHRRRHSDSYFPLKRHNRRHRMRGAMHPKYSYSPNPRYRVLKYRLHF